MKLKSRTESISKFQNKNEQNETCIHKVRVKNYIEETIMYCKKKIKKKIVHNIPMNGWSVIKSFIFHSQHVAINLHQHAHKQL